MKKAAEVDFTWAAFAGTYELVLANHPSREAARESGTSYFRFSSLRWDRRYCDDRQTHAGRRHTSRTTRSLSLCVMVGERSTWRCHP